MITAVEHRGKGSFASWRPTPIIAGYVFRWAHDLELRHNGWCAWERFMPSCFTFNPNGVKIMLGHDARTEVATTADHTAEVLQDSTGLFVRFRPANDIARATSTSHLLAEIRNPTAPRMGASVGFTALRTYWAGDTRIISRATLHEISTTTSPQYRRSRLTIESDSLADMRRRLRQEKQRSL